MKTMRKKYVISISTVVVLLAFYMFAFHGEYCHYVCYEDSTGMYTRAQYIFNIPISQKEWFFPEDTPAKPFDSYSLSYKTSWRGFGLLWKRTTYYD